LAKLNTSIRGAQIATAVAGNGLEWTTDDILGLDLKSTSGLSIDTAELKLDLDNLGAGGVAVAADSIAIIDADDSVTKKESIVDLATAMAGAGLVGATGTLELNLATLSGGTVDVATDKFIFGDSDAGGSPKSSLITALITSIAGSGLTATNGVLSADAVSDNITESDFLYENESANANGSNVTFTLAETPVANSVQVFLNGMIQEEGSAKDYSISGTTITFAVAPSSGDIILIHYVQDN